jgi:hypothetical protein
MLENLFNISYQSPISAVNQNRPTFSIYNTKKFTEVNNQIDANFTLKVSHKKFDGDKNIIKDTKEVKFIKIS